MTEWLKQSTATSVIIGPFIDDADGKTAETSLTVTNINVDLYKGITKSDLTITASGGDNDMAHVANGFYSLELAAGNVDTLGRLMVTANIAGALPVWASYMVLPANAFDSLFSTDLLQVHLAEMTADIITAASIAADAGAEIADAVWDEALAGHSTAGSAGKILDDAGSGLTAADIADAVWDEAMAGHVAAGSAGETLQEAADGTYIGGSSAAASAAKRGYEGIVLGTAITGTLSATGFTTDLTEATNDHYNGRTLTFTTGALAGQQTTITDYNGTTKAVTVTAMTEAPANADEFFIA